MAALMLSLLVALARDRPAFLDRLEGDRAVLLDRGRTHAVPRNAVRGAAEGAAVDAGAADPRATAEARRRLRRDAARVRWRAR